MSIAVVTTYTLTTESILDLPDGKTWDDVTHFHVKWGTLFLSFADGSGAELRTVESSLEDADFKRPDSVTVRPVTGEGFADWGVEALAEEIN